MTPWSWSGNLSLKPGTCLTVVRDLDQVRPTNVSSTELKPVQVAPVPPPLPHPPGGLRFGLYYALLGPGSLAKLKPVSLSAKISDFALSPSHLLFPFYENN